MDILYFKIILQKIFVPLRLLCKKASIFLKDLPFKNILHQLLTYRRPSENHPITTFSTSQIIQSKDSVFLRILIHSIIRPLRFIFI